MFCQSLALGLLGSRVAYALKEPYTLVYQVLESLAVHIFVLFRATMWTVKTPVSVVDRMMA